MKKPQDPGLSVPGIIPGSGDDTHSHVPTQRSGSHQFPYKRFGAHLDLGVHGIAAVYRERVSQV